MNLNPEYLKKSLNAYAKKLPDPPKWIGLVDYAGQLICDVGEINGDNFQSLETIAAKHIHHIGEQAYASLEAVEHGNFQMNICIGGEGTLFIINLNDTFLLAISYHGAGEGCCFNSFDAIAEIMKNNVQIVLKAIFLDELPDTEDENKANKKLSSAGTSTRGNTDAYPLDEATVSFMQGLSGQPRWTMVVDDTGELVGFSGQLHQRNTDANSMAIDAFAQYVHQYIQTTYQALNQMRLDGCKYIILETGMGVTIAFNVPFERWVVVNYPELNQPLETLLEKGFRLQIQKLIKPLPPISLNR